MPGGEDTGWLSGPDQEVERRLAAEVERLDGSHPFAALGVDLEAGDAEVRRRFLVLTKRHHPNRFARRSPEVRRLANEVFVRIKKAYTRIEREEGRAEILERLGRAGGMPSAGVFAETQQVAIPVPASGVIDGEAVKDAPPRARAQVSTRVTFDKPAAAHGREGARGRAPRRSSARRERLLRELTPTPVPSQGKASATRTPAPAPPVQDTDAVAEKVVRREAEREEEWTRGRKLLREGKLAEARETFRRLAVECPTEKRFRTLMHYAWGREHQAGRRDEQARAEYVRALHLDPGFEPALRSLEALPAPKKEKDGSFLSRLFRR